MTHIVGLVVPKLHLLTPFEVTCWSYGPYMDWLVVWNICFFHSVGNVIIPTDALHDFSEGRSTTKQWRFPIGPPPQSSTFPGIFHKSSIQGTPTVHPGRPKLKMREHLTNPELRMFVVHGMLTKSLSDFEPNNGYIPVILFDKVWFGKLEIELIDLCGDHEDIMGYYRLNTYKLYIYINSYKQYIQLKNKTSTW